MTFAWTSSSNHAAGLVPAQAAGPAAPPRWGRIPAHNAVFLAPMAGVTDRPFRQLCRHFGAGYTVSEMVTSRRDLWDSLKTSRRLDHQGEPGPIVVQIAGVDPQMMADAARYNIDRGAQVLDINMGCPAKKVCNTWAGSALMQNESLALRIVEAVVAAAAPHGVPVSLKMRTGWDETQRNAPALARQAQDLGVDMIVIHGRTRAQKYNGQAEYTTVTQIARELSIPVVANGDIDSPCKAAQVLRQTGCAAVMIGRKAQQTPWVFAAIDHFLRTGETLPPPSLAQIQQAIEAHLDDHYHLYGAHSGVHSARKHILWLLRDIPQAKSFLQDLFTLDDPEQQRAQVARLWSRLQWCGDQLQWHTAAATA